MKDRATGTDHGVVIAQGNDQLAVFLAVASPQGFAKNLSQTRRQPIERMIDDLAGVQPGDLPGLVIEHRHPFIRAGRDHARRQVFQQRLVINARVLDFGEQLRVIDRHRQLSAQNLQGVLLHRAINPPGQPRPEQHHARELLAGKNSKRDCGLESPQLLRRLLELWRFSNSMEFIEHQHFLVGLKIRNHGVVPAQPQAVVI